MSLSCYFKGMARRDTSDESIGNIPEYEYSTLIELNNPKHILDWLITSGMLSASDAMRVASEFSEGEDLSRVDRGIPRG